MSTLGIVEQSVLPQLSAGTEATVFAAHLLAMTPMIAAVVLLVAALSAGARRVPAAQIVPRKVVRGRKIGG